MITHTHTSTYNAITFADPYKQCLQCKGWITGVLDAPGPSIVLPCEHRQLDEARQAAAVEARNRWVR